jgi:hypothetical protein
MNANFYCTKFVKAKHIYLKKRMGKNVQKCKSQGPKKNLMHIEDYNICYYISYANLWIDQPSLSLITCV